MCRSDGVPGMSVWMTRVEDAVMLKPVVTSDVTPTVYHALGESMRGSSEAIFSVLVASKDVVHTKCSAVGKDDASPSTYWFVAYMLRDKWSTRNVMSSDRPPVEKSKYLYCPASTVADCPTPSNRRTIPPDTSPRRKK